jgi:hypothetical protein
MEVQSSGDQQNLITKIYGSKENDSEIDFEEEPRTALMASKTTKKPIKRVTIIIF